MALNGEEHILPDQEAVDGKTEMIIKAEGGQVIVRFQKPMLYVKFDGPNAVQVGKHLIDCAVQLGVDVEIKVPRREVSRETRNILVMRCQHIMRSLANKPPKRIAIEVVDSILSAID